MNEMTREDLMNQFQNYPDVVGVTDLCAMLGGVKAKDARQLLQAGKIKSFLIGRKYQIPKEYVIDYLLEDHGKEDQTESNKAAREDSEGAKGGLKTAPKQRRQTTDAQKGKDPKPSARPITQKEAYRLMLQEYPDVMNIEQVSEALGVSTKAVYGLIKGSHLSFLKIGRTYRVPKILLIAYLYGDTQGQSDEEQK
jgi:excisionase family DNA binding protein